VRNNWRFVFARISIAGLFLIVTVLQIFSFPGQFNYSRQQGDINEATQIVLTLFLGSWMLAVQIGLVSLLKIVNLMQLGQFFTASCFKWINRLASAVKYSAFVPIGLILIIAPQADDPGILVVLLTLFLFSTSLAVLVSLLRDQIKSKLED
jgi:hypothetical protein